MDTEQISSFNFTQTKNEINLFMKEYIQSLIQNKNITDDEVRKNFSELTLSSNILKQISQASYSDYTTKIEESKLVLIKVQITDILENDFYAAAQRIPVDGGSQLEYFPFCQSWGLETSNDVLEDQIIFADRQNATADIIMPNYGFQKTGSKVNLQIYHTKMPQLFSVQHIFGLVEDELDENLDVHVIAIIDGPSNTQLEHNYLSLKSRVLQVVNDNLVAEWVLHTLVCNIAYREAGELGGKLVLNIFNVDRKNNLLSQELSKLTSPSRIIQLTLQLLNNEIFYAYRNLDTQKINPSIFNLPINIPSLYIIDETKLEQGNLNEQGYKNIQAIKQNLDNLTIKIDFTYSETNLETQNKFIILSEAKSFLPHDVTVAIMQNQYENPIQQMEYNSILQSLQILQQKQIQVKISEQLKEQISQIYSEMRAEDPNQISPQVLSTLITLMKSYTVLSLSDEATISNFLKAIELWKSTQERNQQFLIQKI